MFKLQIETFFRERRYFCFFILLLVVLYLRLLYQASYFPSYFGGEEAAVLDKIAEVCGGPNTWKYWLENALVMSSDYAKGYSWILVPFCQYFGYDWRLVIWGIPLFTSLFCAGYFTFHRMAYPSRSSILSCLLVIGFALFVLCVRRYKWHAMSYPALFSFYLYFLPHFCSYRLSLSNLQLRLLAVLLFMASCFFYFGNIIYAVPALFFALCLDIKKEWKFKVLLAGLGLALIFAIGTYAFTVNQAWLDRLVSITGNSRELLKPEALEIRWRSVRWLFTVLFSPSFQVLFVLGLVVSLIRMWKSDYFASINLVLFSWTYVIQFLLHGGSNLDSLNWSMLPLFGILLAGSDVICGVLRDRIKYSWLLFVVPVILVWRHEIRVYPQFNRQIPYQQCIYPQDTTTQAALVLRMIQEDGSGSTQYYLPDPSIPVEQGGFNYLNNLKRMEFQEALSRITFFKTEEDLLKKRALLKGQKAGVAYLSFLKEQEEEKNPEKKIVLSDLPSEIVHPYEAILQIRFDVRKTVLE